MPSRAFSSKAVRLIVFWVVVIGVWHFVASAGLWPTYAFPAPSSVLLAFARNIENGMILDALSHSVGRLVVGYSISMLAGLSLGVLCGSVRYADETIGGIILGLQSLPSITWLPMAVLWFGLSDTAIIFVVLMGSTFSIAISARSGIRGLPPLLARAASTIGATRVQLYRYVIIPAMVPAMVQGMKQGWSFAWRSLMAGELLFVTIGLGHLLDVGRNLQDINMVFTVMLVIITVGVVVDRVIFGRAEAWVRERWGYVAT